MLLAFLWAVLIVILVVFIGAAIDQIFDLGVTDCLRSL